MLHFSVLLKIQQTIWAIESFWLPWSTSFFQGISRSACDKWGPLIFCWKSTNSSMISSRSSWGFAGGCEARCQCEIRCLKCLEIWRWNMTGKSVIFFDDLPSCKAPYIEDFPFCSFTFPWFSHCLWRILQPAMFDDIAGYSRAHFSNVVSCLKKSKACHTSDRSMNQMVTGKSRFGTYM